MNHYLSSIKEMQTQLFHVLALAATGASFFGFLLNAFIHGNALPTQVCVWCGLAILIFGVGGLFLKNKGWASVGILITVVWIEFPLLYFVYQEVILVYFVLSILGIIIFFPRKFGIPFCIITVIWDVFVIIATHFHSYDLSAVQDEYLLFYDVCSYLIVAVAIFVLLNVLILRYEKQKVELSEMNEKLDYLASHDPLTKLYNRGYLMKEIEKRIQKDDTCFIAVMMDVDNFKQINDTCGHSFGDLVLTTFAEMLIQEVEGKGFAARFGGEEFMIIYDHGNKEEAVNSLHKLAVQLEDHFKKEHQMSITFSGGLELYSSRKKMDELIRNADNKLYQAEHNGKNQIVC